MVFNWILINKFAIGTPFISEEDKYLLKEKGITTILDLRNKSDFLLIDQKKYLLNIGEFKYKNLQLPDHNSKRLITREEIINAVETLNNLMIQGPVFMHCHAAAERSPLISIALLHLKKNFSLIQSCDYVKQQNKNSTISLKQLKNVNFL